MRPPAGPPLLAALLALGAGCTIARDVPRSQFACSAGGPCVDGGVGPRDAAPAVDAEGDAAPADPDAAPAPDAEAPEAGPPPDAGLHPTCEPAAPLPASGAVSGDTTGGRDHHIGMCVASAGGADDTYYFTTTGTISVLHVETRGSLLDTVVYVYRNACDRAALDCNDDRDVNAGDYSSSLDIPSLLPGTYYVVVDGSGPDLEDRYELSVSGVLAPDSRCQAGQSFLACERGLCLSVPEAAGGRRCQAGLDCVDGFDTDGDGALDEDACAAPPSPRCPAPARALGVRRAQVAASATDDGRVDGVRWTLTSTHALPPRLFDTQTATVTVDPVLAGEYTLRFEAADDRRQTTACSARLTVVPEDLVHVELTWTGAANLDLHLLRPGTLPWFDFDDDCYADSAGGNAPPSLPWGGSGSADDPYLRGVSGGAPGGERVQLLRPVAGTYSVGVAYVKGAAPARALVRIYCGGALTRERSVTLSDAPGASFWKVADVMVGPNGSCVAADRSAPGGGPLLVDITDAQLAR